MNEQNRARQLVRHLPAQMNKTIGREREIVVLSALLQQDDVRLLTLVGPGGVGKTRLALEVAQVSDFEDGVFFVQLAPLQNYTQVVATIAQALAIEESPHMLERLRAYIRDKQLLLMLDNFEHVQEASIQVAELLALAPQLKVLVTSREVLHIYGEHEREVPPLALPTSTERSLADKLPAAVELFIARAQAVKPAFTLTNENTRDVLEICIQLDGLPLAIELAAARIKLLAPSVLLARLQSRLQLLVGGARNLAPRQQTLRNTLDWSYNLLTAAEKYLFRQLGVLLGDWTLEAAEALAPTREGDDTPTLLSSLVDKSLVRVATEASVETRFFLLETIREYALDCLDKHEERAQAQRRHAFFYIQVAEKVEPHLYDSTQQEWLWRLDQEASNVRQAMCWVIEQREGTAGLRLASALARTLQLRLSLTEGYNWLEMVLALDTYEQTKALRARVLYGAGSMASTHNNFERAQARLQESIELATEVGDKRTQALAIGALALVSLHQGKHEVARALAEQGLQIHVETNDIWCRGILHSISGHIASKQCDFKAAQVRYRLGLGLLRRTGDLRSQADVLMNVGNTMRRRGKLVTAHFLYQKGLRLYEEVEDRLGQVACLSGMGETLCAQGCYVDAQKNLEDCLALATRLGTGRERALALFGLGQLASCQGNITGAARYLKESLRLARELGYSSGVALALWCMGDLALQQGYYATAKAHYEQGLTLTRTLEDRVTTICILCGLSYVAIAQQNYEQAGIQIRQAINLAGQIGDMLGLALALEAFSHLCGQAGLPERAVQFLATADALREGLSAPLAQAYRQRREQEIDEYTIQIGENAFAENWSVGRNMSLTHTQGMIANIRITGPASSKEATESYPAGLTPREVDVLRLLASGMTDAHIAQKLVLSPRTVNTHLRSIYAKLAVSSRSAATRFAVENNLV